MSAATGDAVERRGHLRRQRASQLRLAPAAVCAHARDVIERLQQAGHESYLVGGGVRDLLLGETPKDFDVATAAHPEEVRALFDRCRLIGRRFRLAHVYRGGKITEVATFRGDGADAGGFRAAAGRIVRDNAYGGLEQDALRRDFTINSIYYDPFSDLLVSHEHALEDVRARRLRTIGDAERRYLEDPVRMLRAVRFLAKPGLVAEERTGRQITRQRDLLRDVPPARLFDQLLKLFHGGAALQVYRLLREHGLFGVLFPQTMQALEHDAQGAYNDFLLKLLANTDARVRDDLPSTPAFVIAGLWWRPVAAAVQRRAASGRRRTPGLSAEETLLGAVREVVQRQKQNVAVPLRIVAIARDVLLLQRLFTSSADKDVRRLLLHPRFRAAYDFFDLLEQAGLADRRACPGWARIEEAERASRARAGRRRPRRRRPRRGARAGAGDGDAR